MMGRGKCTEFMVCALQKQRDALGSIPLCDLPLLQCNPNYDTIGNTCSTDEPRLAVEGGDGDGEMPPEKRLQPVLSSFGPNR